MFLRNGKQYWNSNHLKISGTEPISINDKLLSEKVENEYRKRQLIKDKKIGKKIVPNEDLIFDVYFHVITNSEGEGSLSNDMVQFTIELLNEGFSGNLTHNAIDCDNKRVSSIDTKISFVLKAITRQSRDEWFYVEKNDYNIKKEQTIELREGNCSTLNIYTMSSINYGGWASGPIRCNPDSRAFTDGVWIDYETIPTSRCAHEYNTRPTNLIHEVGHWVGLEHVFEGGCKDIKNDGVQDTPPQEKSFATCPIGKDSCEGDGVDSIHNYMAYSGDCCKYEFTTGQIIRMHALLLRWRFGPYDPVSIDDY